MRASYKTYRGQKNFYDKNNMHKSLGEVFFYWYICGTKNEQQIQRAYRECRQECREVLLDELYRICDLKLYHTFVNIFLFGHK